MLILCTIYILYVVLFLILGGIHSNAIFNFAWAEPEMKLVTACGDHSSKLCNVHPSGKIDVIKEFISDSSVRSVMFAPGSHGKCLLFMYLFCV